VRSWNTYGAQMNHEHTWTHKIQDDLDLREIITFPLIILFVINHVRYIQMSFCPGIPKFHKCAYKFKIRSFFKIFVEHDLLVPQMSPMMST